MGIFALPFRLVWGLLTFWNVGLFQRKCPDCRHLLSLHQRVGGRFLD